jgi:hypothetical protein
MIGMLINETDLFPPLTDLYANLELVNFTLNPQSYQWSAFKTSKLNSTTTKIKSETIRSTGSIGFWGLAPIAENFGEPLYPYWNSTTAYGMPGYALATRMFGEIWIAIRNELNNRTMDFINCELYNVSTKYTVSFNNHVGAIQNIKTQVVEPISPIFQTEADGSMAYMMYFVEMCKYLIGTVAGYTDEIRDNPGSEWSLYAGNLWTAEIMLTNMALSSQMSSMQTQLIDRSQAELNLPLNMTSTEYLSVVNPDANDVRNASLLDMIEQFSTNASLSLLAVSGFT